VDHFGSIKKIEKASQEEIQSIEGVGPEIAESVADFFKQARNRKYVETFFKRGIKPTHKAKKPKEGPLLGKTFVFTGELGSMSRPEAARKVSELGGKAIGSVSKKTSYVVVGSKPGSKFDKAKKLGVSVLDEKEFLKMIG